MKNMLKIFLAVFIVTALWSCKKEENKVIFEGGTAPELTASTTDDAMVFLLENKDEHAITFNWNNPNYQFNTGISSQDVTYTLQIDTAGSDFSNPLMQEFSIAKDFSKSFTVNDLNDILVSITKMKLPPLMPHQIEIRLKASIGGSVPLYSNVLTYTITPYTDPNIPTLFITGTAVPSNYTEKPPDSQKFTYISDLKFEITLDFEPGFAYKFLTKWGFWQPQWGGAPATGGSLSVNPGNGTDPAEIPTPAEAGKYKLTVDLEAKTLTIVKI